MTRKLALKKEFWQLKREPWLTGRAVALMVTLILGFSLLAVYQQSSRYLSAEEAKGREFDFLLEIDLVDPGEFSRTAEKQLLAARIDSYLTGRKSPMASMGREFVLAEERTGVSAALLVALTLAESNCGTAGSLSASNHNAWGMKGPQPQLGIEARNGYCWWPDWPSAIDGAACFVAHYFGPARTGCQLRGYAASSGPGSAWLSRVEGARAEIVSPGQE